MNRCWWSGVVLWLPRFTYLRVLAGYYNLWYFSKLQSWYWATVPKNPPTIHALLPSSTPAPMARYYVIQWRFSYESSYDCPRSTASHNSKPVFTSVANPQRKFPLSLRRWSFISDPLFDTGDCTKVSLCLSWISGIVSTHIGIQTNSIGHEKGLVFRGIDRIIGAYEMYVVI